MSNFQQKIEELASDDLLRLVAGFDGELAALYENLISSDTTDDMFRYQGSARMVLTLKNTVLRELQRRKKEI